MNASTGVWNSPGPSSNLFSSQPGPLGPISVSYYSQALPHFLPHCCFYPQFRPCLTLHTSCHRSLGGGGGVEDRLQEEDRASALGYLSGNQEREGP